MQLPAAEVFLTASFSQAAAADLQVVRPFAGCAVSREIFRASPGAICPAFASQRSMKTRSLTLLRFIALLGCLFAFQGVLNSIHGQPRKIRPAFGFGIVSQDGPLAGQSGPVLTAGIPLTIARYFAITPEVDFATLSKGDENALCLRVQNGGCLSQPKSESFFDAALTAGFALPLGRNS
jgi:hypothetical protein